MASSPAALQGTEQTAARGLGEVEDLPVNESPSTAASTSEDPADVDTTTSAWIERVPLPNGERLLLQEEYWSADEYDTGQVSSNAQVWEAGMLLVNCLHRLLLYEPVWETSPFLDYSASAGPPFETSSSACNKNAVAGAPTRSCATSRTVLLDLGTGTGVCGLAAAKMGLADHIVLTDLPLVLETVTRENVKRNHDFISGQQVGREVTVECMPLDWREINDDKIADCLLRSMTSCDANETGGAQNKCSASTATGDVLESTYQGIEPVKQVNLRVIASDLVYAEQEVPNLLSVVTKLAEWFHRNRFTSWDRQEHDPEAELQGTQERTFRKAADDSSRTAVETTRTTKGASLQACLQRTRLVDMEFLFTVQFRPGETNRAAIAVFVTSLIRLVLCEDRYTGKRSFRDTTCSGQAAAGTSGAAYAKDVAFYPPPTAPEFYPMYLEESESLLGLTMDRLCGDNQGLKHWDWKVHDAAVRRAVYGQNWVLEEITWHYLLPENGRASVLARLPGKKRGTIVLLRLRSLE